MILRKEGYVYVCGGCGAVSMSAYSRQRYCSEACKNKAKRQDLAFVRGVILRARRKAERVYFAEFVRTLLGIKRLLQLPFSVAYTLLQPGYSFHCCGPG